MDADIFEWCSSLCAITSTTLILAILSVMETVRYRVSAVIRYDPELVEKRVEIMMSYAWEYGIQMLRARSDASLMHSIWSQVLCLLRIDCMCVWKDLEYRVGLG